MPQLNIMEIENNINLATINWSPNTNTMSISPRNAVDNLYFLTKTQESQVRVLVNGIMVNGDDGVVAVKVTMYFVCFGLFWLILACNCGFCRRCWGWIVVWWDKNGTREHLLEKCKVWPSATLPSPLGNLHP